MNVAPTVTGEVPIVKVHAPVPEHGPLHPPNTKELEAGVAFRVTVLPVLIVVVFVHVPEVAPEVIVQLMLPVPDTLPFPVPAAVTLTVVALKVALTDLAASIATVQGTAVPVQAPLQPANANPAEAVGVRATEVPLSYCAEQLPEQLLIPAGFDETVPVPVVFTVNAN